MKNNVLVIDNLQKRYPAFELKGASMSVEAGRIMGFIGKNGAGKSTTLKAMLKLVHPDGGRVFMFGRDFYQNELYCKQRIGVVLGGIDFYPKKKIPSLTAVTKRFYPDWDDAKYVEYLKMFEIDPSKRADELSSGMKVKYLIAVALSHGAKLLIFDEPTSGLDPVSRDDLLGLFKALVENGERSILFSTHITSDLEKCADGITYIKNGEIIASRDKDAFMSAFQHLRNAEGKPPSTLEEVMILSERVSYDEKFNI